MNANTLPLGADEHLFFEMVTALVRSVQAGEPLRDAGYVLDGAAWVESTREEALFWVDREHEPAFGVRGSLPAAIKQLLELYVPLCLGGGARRLTIAHLGQSLDGRIATETGASRYVTGQENLIHVHRLRALCDAVLVGARTVAADDPQLTTRLVSGRSPVRVVIDSQRRLSAESRIFHDGAAPTCVICARGASRRAPLPARVEVIELDSDAGAISPENVLGALHERGLRWVFLEGGGLTVSRFLLAGVLDRLHLTVAPIVLGAGVSALSLPGLRDVTQALRPRTRRFFLGDDVLFDCALERGRTFGGARAASDGA
ncbi:MAG TPA: RibD family protein [Polyangiaceae bacterium]|nr:RibD family protein [Polyangiaceae bacterium]